MQKLILNQNNAKIKTEIKQASRQACKQGSKRGNKRGKARQLVVSNEGDFFNWLQKNTGQLGKAGSEKLI